MLHRVDMVPGRTRHRWYRGTSIIRNSLSQGTYSSICLGPYGGPRGGGRFLMSEVTLYRSPGVINATCKSCLGMRSDPPKSNQVKSNQIQIESNPHKSNQNQRQGSTLEPKRPGFSPASDAIRWYSPASDWLSPASDEIKTRSRAEP